MKVQELIDLLGQHDPDDLVIVPESRENGQFRTRLTLEKVESQSEKMRLLIEADTGVKGNALVIWDLENEALL